MKEMNKELKGFIKQILLYINEENNYGQTDVKHTVFRRNARV